MRDGDLLPDEAVRVRLASAAETPPDVLAALARDPAATVRAALALNAALPQSAEGALVRDPDDRVRALLARRLAALVPSLDEPALYRRVMKSLSDLVEDEATRVRAAIADAVKALPSAPRALILRLVHDADVAVGAAVIELSPVLTTGDLIALLDVPGYAAGCVARRPNLPAEVADAIALHGGSGLVQALLENASAQIREATLDALAGQAAAHPNWHGPLARRPTLSAAAAEALSRFVAADLLRALAERSNLPPELLADVRRRLAEQGESQPDDLMAAARALQRSGGLDETALLDALRRGDTRRAAALLAVASRCALAAVERAAAMRSAKGLVSLVWQAGFTMRAARAAQILLGQLGPDQALKAGPDGAFPLSIEEMRWQIEFLGRRAS